MWTDDEVYDLIGLTQDERDTIDALIPDYYGRKKSRQSASKKDRSLIDDDDSGTKAA